MPVSPTQKLHRITHSKHSAKSKRKKAISQENIGIMDQKMKRYALVLSSIIMPLFALKVGTAVTLLSMAIFSGTAYFIYTDKIEKWLDDNQMYFFGGALGFLVEGPLGAACGIWLVYFTIKKIDSITEKVNQITDNIAEKTQAVKSTLGFFNQFVPFINLEPEIKANQSTKRSKGIVKSRYKARPIKLPSQRNTIHKTKHAPKPKVIQVLEQQLNEAENQPTNIVIPAPINPPIIPQAQNRAKRSKGIVDDVEINNALHYRF